MRLTLRTLLAWRDGLLSADDTRDIATRVESSLTARLMAARIDAVTSAQESLRHAGSSEAGAATRGRSESATRGLAVCNDIAEYIANSLPSEGVAAFEKECLQSAGLLSEVAGCHRLIAELERDPTWLAIADPAEVDRLKVAMQAANRRAASGASSGRGRLEDTVVAGTPSAAVIETTASISPRTNQTTASNDRRLTPRREGEAIRTWSAAVAALLLVAALMLALVFVLMSPKPMEAHREIAERAPEAARPDLPQPPAGVLEDGHGSTEASAAAPTSAVPGESGEEPATVGDVGSDTVADVEGSLSGSPAMEAQPARPQTALAESGEQPVADDTPPAAPGKGDPVPDRSGTRGVAGASGPRPVPGGEAMAIAAPASTVTSVPPVIERPSRDAEETPPDAPSEDADAIGAFTDVPLVFVRRQQRLPGRAGDAEVGDATGDDPQPAGSWGMARAKESIRADDELVVPGHFFPDITLAGRRLRLFPMTRLRVDASAGDGTPRIELLEGRVAVLSTGDGLTVRIGGLGGRVEAAPGAVIGLELTRRPSDGIDPLVASAEGTPEAADVQTAEVRFPAGGRWTPIDERSRQPDSATAADPEELSPGNALSWSSRQPETVSLGALEANRDWTQAPDPPERLERMAAEALADRVSSVSPVERALRELAVDAQVEHRLAAVEALAAMGRYDELVELLCADGAGDDLSPTQWRSLVERAVLPALARGPRDVESLLAALEDRSPHGEAGRLYSFAVGFSDEDLENGAANDLVEALDHPELVVRRFAAWRLEQIVRPKATERLRYRAERSPSLRADGVRWWRQQLEKGLIRRAPAGGLSRG